MVRSGSKMPLLFLMLQVSNSQIILMGRFSTLPAVQMAASWKEVWGLLKSLQCCAGSSMWPSRCRGIMPRYPQAIASKLPLCLGVPGTDCHLLRAHCWVGTQMHWQRPMPFIQETSWVPQLLNSSGSLMKLLMEASVPTILALSSSNVRTSCKALRKSLVGWMHLRIVPQSRAH